MSDKISKSAAIAILVSLLIFILVVVSNLIINSPTYYPDKWLNLENRATSFLEQITLPIKIARLSWLPADKEILMPVYGIKVREVQNSWHDARPDDRLHEGQDIFADRGTPVFSGTNGYVVRIGMGELGGNFVYVVGAGGRRYYYAHFDRIPDGLRVGQKVTPDTVIGFVGNTGNADVTPTHLHFGVYLLGQAINPLPLLKNRW